MSAVPAFLAVYNRNINKTQSLGAAAMAGNPSSTRYVKCLKITDHISMPSGQDCAKSWKVAHRIVNDSSCLDSNTTCFVLERLENNSARSFCVLASILFDQLYDHRLLVLDQCEAHLKVHDSSLFGALSFPHCMVTEEKHDQRAMMNVHSSPHAPLVPSRVPFVLSNTFCLSCQVSHREQWMNDELAHTSVQHLQWTK